MVNNIPVPKDKPPVNVAYQFNTPALSVAPNITVPESQRDPSVVLNTVGVKLTAANTDVLGKLVHPIFVAST